MLDILSENQLKEGDHESISLLGCSEQEQLQTVSKSIAAIMNQHDLKIEETVQDIVMEMDQFEKELTVKRKIEIDFLKKDIQKKIIKRYSEILHNINNIEIMLKMQETSLIKDSQMLEQMKRITTDTAGALENIINYGTDILNKKEVMKDTDETLGKWYVRLSKKIEDLNISHTIAMQSNMQIQLIMDNNRKLVDRILEAVSTTLPLWRNQVSLLLGVEKTKRNIEVQNDLTRIIIKSMAQGKKDVDKVDTNKILDVNNKLQSTLKELIKEENQNYDEYMELGKLIN